MAPSQAADISTGSHEPDRRALGSYRRGHLPLTAWMRSKEEASIVLRFNHMALSATKCASSSKTFR